MFHSSAPPARLFDLLADAPGWPAWFWPARRVDWAAGPGGQRVGPGAVRQVALGPVRVREAILEEERPSHHAYGIRSVIPVRDHRADVWFVDSGSGTRITWSTTFRARVPGTGRFTRWALRAAVARLARALTTAAEQAPDDGGQDDNSITRQGLLHD